MDFDEDPEADQMAALMGFSSFSAPSKQPQAKRRKVEAGTSTGANDVPLGAPRASRSSRAEQQDEDEGEEEEKGQSAKDTLAFTGASGFGTQIRSAATEAGPSVGATGHELPVRQYHSQSQQQTRGAGQGQHQPGPAPRHPVLDKTDVKELTHADLEVLKRGVSDGEGNTVIFMKSFIEEDPWAGL